MINVLLCVPSSVEPRGASVNWVPLGPPWWSQDRTREQDDRSAATAANYHFADGTHFIRGIQIWSVITARRVWAPEDGGHQIQGPDPFRLALQGLSAGSPSPKCWVHHVWVHSETPQRLCRRFSWMILTTTLVCLYQHRRQSVVTP